MPSWTTITSESIARLDNLSGSNDASYLDVRQNLSRSLTSFRGPNYPMVGAATGTIEHYQDSFVYERFLETAYDETIYNWRSYFGTPLPYLLSSGGWAGNNPARVIGFPEQKVFVYGTPENLQGWWRLNKQLTTGSADDSSGNNMTGSFADDTRRPSFAANVSPSQFIQTGSSNFDTVTVGMNIGPSSEWDATIGKTGTSKMTIVCWIYVDVDFIESYGSLYPRIADFGNTDIYLYFRKDRQRLVFSADWDVTRGTWYIRRDTVSLGTWHHVAITYDATSTGNDPKIYVDGVSMEVLESSAPAGSFVGITGTKPCFIANRPDGDRAFTGKMADFAIWNSVLEDDEIKAIYNAASNGSYFATSSFSLNKPKTALLGRPEFTSKSACVGFTYANNETGIDSLAFMGLKK